MYYLKKNTDTIYKSKFDNKIFDENGNLITGYSVADNEAFEGVSSGNVVTFTDPDHPFLPGENILMTEADGIKRPNVVVNVGDDKIEVKKPIYKQGAVSVILLDVKISFTNLEDGIYTFTDHSSMIVAGTFANIHIPTNILLDRYRNKLLGVAIDFETMNYSAMLKVLADFHYNLTFFQTVDIAQLTELVILAIGVNLESQEDNLRYTNKYSAYLKTVSTSLKSDNGNLNGNVGVDIESLKGFSSFDFTWGAR